MDTISQLHNIFLTEHSYKFRLSQRSNHQVAQNCKREIIIGNSAQPDDGYVEAAETCRCVTVAVDV
jgi:hypothetical protein